MTLSDREALPADSNSRSGNWLVITAGLCLVVGGVVGLAITAVRLGQIGLGTWCVQVVYCLAMIGGSVAIFRVLSLLEAVKRLDQRVQALEDAKRLSAGQTSQAGQADQVTD